MDNMASIVVHYYDIVEQLITGTSLPTLVVLALFGISVCGVVVYSLHGLLGLLSLILGLPFFKDNDDDGLETLRRHERVLDESDGTKTQKKKKKKKKMQHICPGQPGDSREEGLTADAQHSAPSQTKGVSLKNLQKISTKYSSCTKNVSMKRHDSELYVETLKGHTDAVVGLSWASSSCGEGHECLVTACKDRDMRMFSIGSGIKSTCLVQQVIRGGIFL